MNLGIIVGIIFVIVMLVLVFTPAYHEYRNAYIEKVGYSNPVSGNCWN